MTALLWPATAQAVNQTITVGQGGNRTLTPSGSVSIDPDETVTWQWAAGSERHHIRSNAGSAEAWDSGERDVGSLAHAFVRSGSFSYTCLLHPDLMNGTISVSGAPQASFAPPTPAQPFTDDLVSFDATGSTDPDGTIVSYAWDFDGNGSFDETNLVPTTTHPYPTAGTFTARLRITDNRANTHDTTRAVTVRSHVPVASFTATPASVAKNVVVTFDAAASTDADGPLATYDWDLDGDGVFELLAALPTVSRSYTAAGPVTVRLRVTDGDLPTARTAQTTRGVVVTNAPPTASIAASTTTPANGASVTFDASGSADTDGGTIASYAWDLDGDGIFETPGGTTPTISRVFAATGPNTVRARVTDNEGASADASVVVTVAAPPAPPPAAVDPPPAPVDPPPATVDPPAPVPVEPTPTAQPVAAPAAPPALVASGSTPPAPAGATASAPANQRLRLQRGVRVRVNCPVACKVVLTGSVRVGAKRLRLTRLQRSLTAGATTTLTVLVDPRDRNAMRRARGKAQATVIVRRTVGSQTTTKSLAFSLKS